MVLLLTLFVFAKIAPIVYNSGSFLILQNIRATQSVAFSLNAAEASVG